MTIQDSITFIQNFISDLTSSMLRNGISDPRTINAFVEKTAFTLGLDKELVIELINKELTKNSPTI